MLCVLTEDCCVVLALSLRTSLSNLQKMVVVYDCSYTYQAICIPTQANTVSVWHSVTTSLLQRSLV